MRKHEWHETTAEGEKRYYRALFHGGQWILKSTLKSDPDWHKHEPITLENYRQMREVLWKKYTRRNCPYRHIEIIDEEIEKLEGQEKGRSRPADHTE